MNEKQKQTNVKFSIEELKELIDEARNEGLNQVANFWAEELRLLLANDQLVGNKPRP